MEHKETHIHWIDIAKAIVMFLVVFGHVMRGGSAQRVVYSFHVVAFFFLSGMTCKADQISARIRKDFFRIMIPYYSFGILSIGFYVLLGSVAASKFEMRVDTSFLRSFLGLMYASGYKGYLQFNAPLWFLPCLFATKLLYYGIYKAVSGKQGHILIVSILLGTLGFGYTHCKLPIPPFSFSIALKMLPFFCLGRMFFFRAQSVQMTGRCRGAFLGISLMCLAVTAAIGYWAPKVNYLSDSFPNIPAFCVTASLGCLGICLLSMSVRQCRLLEYIGRNTLPILVMHKFPVVFFQVVGPFEKYLAENDSMSGVLFGGIPVSVTAIVMCLIANVVVMRYFPFLLGMDSKRRKLS